MPEQLFENYSIWLMIVPLVALYIFMIIPQRRKDKATQDMRNDIMVGDRVITVGGIIGRVVQVKDDVVTIETGNEKTRLRMMKTAISQKESPEE